MTRPTGSTARKLTLSFTAEPEWRDWLFKRAAMMALERGEKISMGQVIIAALSEHKKKVEKK